MSSATLTPVPGGEQILGQLRFHIADFVPSSSYPNASPGGEPFADLAQAACGISNVLGVQILGVDADAGGYVVQWNKDTKKIQIFRSAGFTPAGTNGTSAVTGTAAAQTFTGSAASLTATSSKPTFSVESSGAIGANCEVGLSADSAGATFEGGTGISAQRVLTTTSPVGTPTITPGAYTPAGTNGSSAVTGTAAAQTFTGTAVAAAKLVEVANSVDLSALAIRLGIWGT